MVWLYKQVTFVQMTLKNALDTSISIYLLQGLFPAVALFAERTSKLLSMNAGASAAATLTRTRASNLTAGTSGTAAASAAARLTSIKIFGAHLFL